VPFSRSIKVAVATLFLATATFVASATEHPGIDALGPPQSEQERKQFYRSVESLKLRDASQLPSLARLLDKLMKLESYEAASMVGSKIQSILYVNGINNVELTEKIRLTYEAIPKTEHAARVRLSLSLAYLYSSVLGDGRSAIHYSELCIAECQAAGKAGATIAPRLVLARIYSEWQQHADAITVYEDILAASKSMDEKGRRQTEFICHSQLAALHSTAGNTDLAKEFFKLAISNTESTSSAAQIMVHLGYAEQFIGESNFEQASELLETTETLLSSTPEHEEQCSEISSQIAITRAYLSLAKGNPEAAQKELPSEPPIGILSRKYYQVKRDIHEAIGEFELAFQAQSELLTQVEKSTLGVKNQAAKSTENWLSNQKESLKKAADDSRKIRNLVAGFAVAAVLASFFFFRVNTNRRIQSKLHDQERQTNARLSNLVEEKTAKLVSRMEEQATLEQELERKRRHEALGQLTGGVAHDINNALQVIMVSNEMMQLASDSELNETQMSMLQASKESVNMAASIVQQLLAFARRQRLSPETLRAADVLDSQRPLLKTALGDRIDLHILVDCPQTNIRVDSAQLTSSLLNLLTNSAHSMSKSGGRVVIEAKEVFVEPQEFKDVEPGEYMRIDVTDNGSGMTEPQVLRCCEPFFSTKPPNEGTGLGLSTVQGFVRQSGGELSVTSTRGVGTTVSMYFPVEEPQESTIPHAFEPSKAFLGAVKTLLVDDSELVRQVLVRKLESMGMEVATAESGDAALKFLESNHNIQFVLSDIHMPGSTDGRQLREKIRRSHPHIPVVLMTGYDDSSSGIDDGVLCKPFTDQELLEKFGALQLAHAG
jgi:signal transduction histidine kinase